MTKDYLIETYGFVVGCELYKEHVKLNRELRSLEGGYDNSSPRNIEGKDRVPTIEDVVKAKINCLDFKRKYSKETNDYANEINSLKESLSMFNVEKIADESLDKIISKMQDDGIVFSRIVVGDFVVKGYTSISNNKTTGKEYMSKSFTKEHIIEQITEVIQKLNKWVCLPNNVNEFKKSTLIDILYIINELTQLDVKVSSDRKIINQLLAKLPNSFVIHNNKLKEYSYCRKMSIINSRICFENLELETAYNRLLELERCVENIKNYISSECVE